MHNLVEHTDGNHVVGAELQAIRGDGVGAEFRVFIVHRDPLRTRAEGSCPTDPFTVEVRLIDIVDLPHEKDHARVLKRVRGLEMEPVPPKPVVVFQALRFPECRNGGNGPAGIVDFGVLPGGIVALHELPVSRKRLRRQERILCSTDADLPLDDPPGESVVIHPDGDDVVAVHVQAPVRKRIVAVHVIGRRIVWRKQSVEANEMAVHIHFVRVIDLAHAEIQNLSLPLRIRRKVLPVPGEAVVARKPLILPWGRNRDVNP